jgi:NAD+ kinase
MKLKKALVIHSVWGCPTTKKVKWVLAKHGINHVAVHRARLQKRMCQNKDLVICVGGDGTVLRTSHFIVDGTPLLAVNCDVNSNVGFFMRANRDNFESRLERMMKDKHKLLRLTRLKIKLKGRWLPELALNDVYLGDRQPCRMSRYWLDGEYQRSSGVIVSTGAGSHAWYSSAGGKPLPITSERFAYMVREPYHSRFGTARKLRGMLKRGQKLNVKSDIYDGIVVIDSVSRQYRFDRGATAVVTTSNRKLNLVSF